MKNLILGVAKGYSWDILEPFVMSCKKNCPDAEIQRLYTQLLETLRETFRHSRTI